MASVLRWCWLGCLVAVVAACSGGNKVVCKPGNECLADIRVDGNVAIDDDTLKKGLMLDRENQTQRQVDPYQLNVDTDRIRTAYQKLGFFKVVVVARVDHTGQYQHVVFTVTEGPRATTKLAITGLPPDISEEKVRKLIGLRDGAPFDYEVYDDAKDPLLALLQNAGYAHAQLDAAVLADPQTGVATLRFAFEAGPHCTFGPTSVNGVDGALADAIINRVTFHEGDPYSATAVVATQKAINEIGRFSSVRIEPDPNPALAVIPVKIAVALGTRYEGKLGGGFGYEPLTVEVRGRAGISAASTFLPWIPCALCTASVDFQPAYTLDHTFSNPEPKLQLLGRIKRIDLFRGWAPWLNLTGIFEVGLDYLTVEAYTSIGEHVRPGLSLPLGLPWLTLSVGWLLEEVEFTAIAPPIAADPTIEHGLGYDINDQLSEFQGAIVADYRDEPFATHRGRDGFPVGVYLSLGAAKGTQFLYGNLHYYKLDGDLRLYTSLGPRFVLAGRAHYGAIIGDVAPTERFYAGGAASERGFSERRLSPDVGGFVVGGAGIIEGGVELRTVLGKLKGFPVGGVLFYDVGDVTDAASQLDVWHLHHAVGTGIRFEIIKSVNVRLDLGFRLNRYDDNEPEPGAGYYNRLAVHLGIGEAY